MNETPRDACACGCGGTRERRYNTKTGERLKFIPGHARRRFQGEMHVLSDAQRQIVREEIAEACGWTEGQSWDGPRKPVGSRNYRVIQMVRDVERALNWSPTLRRLLVDRLREWEGAP